MPGRALVLRSSCTFAHVLATPVPSNSCRVRPQTVLRAVVLRVAGRRLSTPGGSDKARPLDQLLAHLRRANNLATWKASLAGVKGADCGAHQWHRVLQELTELFVALFEQRTSWDAKQQSLAGIILCEFMQLMTSSSPPAPVLLLERVFRTVFPQPSSGTHVAALPLQLDLMDFCFLEYQRSLAQTAATDEVTQKQIALLDERSQWGLPTDVEDWNFVLRSAPVSSGRDLSALDRIYSTMAARGIFPNASTAHALMAHYLRLRKFAKVVDLFHIFFPNMLQAEANVRREIPAPLRPLAFTPSPLFVASPVPWNIQGPDILWTSQRSSPVALPNAEVCRCLLEVLAGRREVERIMEVFGMMLELSLPLTTESFDFLFQAMQEEYPEKLLESCFLMLDYQVEPPELLYELLPVAFARASPTKEDKWHVLFREFLPSSKNQAHVVDAIFAELRRRDPAHPQLFVLYRLLKDYPWFPSSLKPLCIRSLFMRRDLREVLACFVQATEEGMDIDPDAERELQLVFDRVILCPLSARSSDLREQAMVVARYRQACQLRRQDIRSRDEGWLLSYKIIDSYF
eukprot:g61667.t1